MSNTTFDAHFDRNLTTAVFGVDGMTCDHCRQAVAAEVYRIPGVVQAYVDLDHGTVTVASDEEIAVAQVAAAVAEAGYTLLPDRSDTDTSDREA